MLRVEEVLRATTARPRSVSLAFPFLDLKAQFEGIRDEVMDAVAATMRSQRFILGPEVEQLEREIAGCVGSRFAIACASGSDADPEVIAENARAYIYEGKLGLVG